MVVPRARGAGSPRPRRRARGRSAGRRGREPLLHAASSRTRAAASAAPRAGARARRGLRAPECRAARRGSARCRSSRRGAGNRSRLDAGAVKDDRHAADRSSTASRGSCRCRRERSGSPPRAAPPGRRSAPARRSGGRARPARPRRWRSPPRVQTCAITGQLSSCSLASAAARSTGTPCAPRRARSTSTWLFAKWTHARGQASQGPSSHHIRRQQADADAAEARAARRDRDRSPARCSPATRAAAARRGPR